MIKPLGPDGVRKRMAEIEARMEQLNPRRSAPSFQSVLEKAGLSSTIRLIQISHKPCKFPPDKMVCFGTLEEIRE